MPGLCVNTLNGHLYAIWALSLLPNGWIASGSTDNSIKIWDITQTYPLETLTGHTDVIRALTVINNEYLASCSHDLTIKLWSLSSYSIVKSWTASTSWLLALASDSTLNVLASGDFANLVKVWDSSIWTQTTTATTGRYTLVQLSSNRKSFIFNFSSKKNKP